jgi:hypothetical protein
MTGVDQGEAQPNLATQSIPHTHAALITALNGTLYKAEPHAENTVGVYKGRRKFASELWKLEVRAAGQTPGPTRMYWKRYQDLMHRRPGPRTENLVITHMKWQTRAHV